jgi:hypothetical protein
LATIKRFVQVGAEVDTSAYSPKDVRRALARASDDNPVTMKGTEGGPRIRNLVEILNNA